MVTRYHRSPFEDVWTKETHAAEERVKHGKKGISLFEIPCDFVPPVPGLMVFRELTRVRKVGCSFGGEWDLLVARK